MKKMLSFVVAVFCCTIVSFAQIPLTVAPSGGNKKATVGEKIGLTDVTIHYDRPHVNGREGKIWGQLVPVGFTDQGFGSSKAAPWRAGSNENTTIYFSHDVKIEGKDLKAGTYGFFIDVEKDGPWTIIFSKNNSSWGSFFYDEKEDALRAKVNPKDAEYTEWLTFGFEDKMPNT